MNIDANPITMKEMVDQKYFFVVPYYQRLYVWKREQIEILLKDLWDSFLASNKFYLGETLVVKKNVNEINNNFTFFELIDGQQRLTTLWFMSLLYQNSLKSFQCKKYKNNTIPRIRFSIRDDINEFFKNIIKGKKANINGGENIEYALKIIEEFVRKIKYHEFTDFTNYLFKNVQLILTQLPHQIDLNKTFEVINNRGTQLQHHEILKSRLLKKIGNRKLQIIYSKLWNACSNMDAYIEKNFKNETSINPRQLFDQEDARVNKERLSKAEEVLKFLRNNLTRNNTETKEYSLKYLLENDISIDDHEKEFNQIKVPESPNIQSIINFPMLLQHTLRIWLIMYKDDDLPKISDKMLLDLFEEKFYSPTEDNVKSFLNLLWEIRYIFDKYVIKWVDDNSNNFNEKILSISQIYKIKEKQNKKPTISRTFVSVDELDKLSMLQSMLYHSQQLTTQYWLTPLFAYIYNYKESNKEYFNFLKHLDNHLLCSTDDRSLIERTYDFVKTPYLKKQLNLEILDSDLGTSFPHYWFYKLEFILWYYRGNLAPEKSNWDNYIITAKNSIEHISPQDPRDTDTNQISVQNINKFGNLALVSRGINSEYSNLPFNEKSRRFLNKKQKDNIESLKLDLIYQNNKWNDKIANKHKVDMKNVIKEYIGKN